MIGSKNDAEIQERFVFSWNDNSEKYHLVENGEPTDLKDDFEGGISVSGAVRSTEFDIDELTDEEEFC